MPVGSGLPRDKAFPTVRRGEIDYEGQLAEFGRAMRSLRRVVTGVVLVTGILAVVLAISGRTESATGILVTIILPLAIVLIIVEIVALARGRRRRRDDD